MFFDLINCCEKRSRVYALKGSYGNECLLSPACSHLCVFVVKARLRSPSLLNIFNFSCVGEDPKGVSEAVAWTSEMRYQEPFSNCVLCPSPSLPYWQKSSCFLPRQQLCRIGRGAVRNSGGKEGEGVYHDISRGKARRNYGKMVSVSVIVIW